MDSHLRLGIRSKEFNMEGSLEHDATPLDTDFSEITQDNFNVHDMYGNRIEPTLGTIIDSTVSSGFGGTYYVVKKGDYDEEKSYTDGSKNTTTRYLRTSIGSNKISCIITNEWNQEYAYSMAQNGIYIPVVDLNSEQVLFTREQYDRIREKMKGLTFYRADNFEIDKNVKNGNILRNAENLKKEAETQISTQEKKTKIVELVKRNMPKTVVEDMIGDISSKTLEFIDTGSTGRGTNIPGDGDFDFMLKCSSMDEQTKMIAQMRTFIYGTPKGGDNEFNIRYEDVTIDGLDTPVDIDVTSEKKELQVEYSSDLCIRDRLDNIRNIYGDEAASQVVDNIIVAKKRLKEIGAYKKSNSDGATELGGFGGIGVENWILQNGGSFILAMETFLDATKDENGKNISFEEFQKRYPIYDFGQNHRANTINKGHDKYVEGLTSSGFDKMKEEFPQILREYGIEYEYEKDGHQIEKIEPEEYNIEEYETQEQNENMQFEKNDDFSYVSEGIMFQSSEEYKIQQDEENQFELYESLIDYKPDGEEYMISDISRMYGLFAKYKGRSEIKEKNEHQETIAI